MQRYFTETKITAEDTIVLNGDNARHISRVMRMKAGDSIICCGPDGNCAVCQIQEMSSDDVTVSVQEFLDEIAELPVHVTIAQGLPKGDKLDLIVQKGTELGASHFQPFEAERSIVKWDRKKRQKKTERLRKIAKEAAEQSHRSQIPTVDEPVRFQEVLSKSSQYDQKIFAYEEAAKASESKNFPQVLQRMDPASSILIVIGPEGGFSEAEADLLKDSGFFGCGFGPRILRTETAALYALSAISYQFELLR
ncbi:MAG TPA: 16S rRNA (uracil(1498)-N(3))-methyltransferase [Bacillales bacterium]|nr:16S rRNA (uracil(1498)-N(3))-methyltransferase [Bacillales bacterium]